MKTIIKRGFAIGAVLTIVLAFSACSKLTDGLDVVATDSVKSFSKILDVLPDKVQADEMNGGWSLSAPDDSAKFIWSKDYSASPLHDVMIEISAQPFIDAGLDPTKLPEHIVYYEDKMMIGVKLGDDKLEYDGDATPLASYEQIVDLYRDTISYHTALDHYGVKLGDGNMFEWAKDLDTNANTKEVQDKDIVFVLNPEPLISAGVNPDAVEGWAFAKVQIEEDGKKLEVDKLLKPFDLQ